MLLVSDAKKQGLIPEEYWGLVPDICESGCGQPLEITRNLKTIRCVDPRCIHKLSGRGAAMLKNLGIKGAGVSYCKKFIQANDYGSHIGILLANKEEHIKTGHSVTGLTLMNTIDSIKKKQVFTFPSLITLMSLPHLRSRTKEIFHGVNSYDEWLYNLEEQSLTPEEYISELPGFGAASAKKICTTLKLFETELKTITKIFRVKAAPLLTYNIAVTGKIYELEYAFNRSEYGKYLNELGENFIEVNISKALKTCDYIVADCLDKGNEYTYTTTSIAGLTREANGEEGVLINSQEMADKIIADVVYLKECAAEWYRKKKTVLT